MNRVICYLVLVLVTQNIKQNAMKALKIGEHYGYYSTQREWENEQEETTSNRSYPTEEVPLERPIYVENKRPIEQTTRGQLVIIEEKDIEIDEVEEKDELEKEERESQGEETDDWCYVKI